MTVVHPHRTPAIATFTEAEALLVRLSGTMEALLNLVEAETILVRQGKVADAARLQADKADLTHRYVRDMQLIQANVAALKRLAPDHVTRLRVKHEGFRAELQINMAVLATAKAVAEGIVHEIADIVARQDQPVLYGAKGVTKPSTGQTTRPVSVNTAI